VAISPPGDIILDVARAADPEKVEAARARLKAFATAGGTDFEAVGLRQTPPTRADVPDTFVKFEAMVLQSFLQNMLPEDGDSVFGAGLSGEMWRGMLAQQLGEVMARRGGIGIAERVLGNHYLHDGKKIPVAGVSSGPEAEAAAEQSALAAALVQELERQAARTIAGDDHEPADKKT
jgi:peptidoglycan hydrolase FlgJ